MARGNPTGSLTPEEVFVFRAMGWAALALVGAGDRLWDLEVPEDEGGIKGRAF
jgi:hypothetical protein